MRFSHFFVDRPIFAGVVSIIVTLLGFISFRALPITEYPEIAPPTVVVNATFAGASAEVIAQTVAAPIEQEINGVDNMLYVVSQSTGNGALAISVVFKPGTNIDQAQVLVQNRVSVALPRLPQEVQRIGVTVRKNSPDLMLVIHLISPDGILDQQYISNYATINIKDVITRIDGVGDTIVFGARDYSMRVWLDPAKVQARNLTASDVVAALRAANVQVAAGSINQPPATSPSAFEIAVQTLGRLSDPEQFKEIVVATDDKVDVPSVLGMTPKDAEVVLLKAELKPGKITETQVAAEKAGSVLNQTQVAAEKAGSVLNQTPVAGDRAPRKSEVAMEVGVAKRQVVAPEFDPKLARVVDLAGTRLHDGATDATIDLTAALQNLKIKTTTDLDKLTAMERTDVRDKLGIRTLAETDRTIAALKKARKELGE